MSLNTKVQDSFVVGAPEGTLNADIGDANLDGDVNVAGSMSGISTGVTSSTFAFTAGTAPKMETVSSGGSGGFVSGSKTTPSGVSPGSSVGTAAVNKSKPSAPWESCPWVGGPVAPKNCSPVSGGWHCGATPKSPMPRDYWCK